MSIDNDPRSGRPRTSTDERNLKLVADALEEDRRAIRKDLSGATGLPTTSVLRYMTNELKRREISAR